MKKVICFGEILWDNFETGKKPGGAPMNVALHLFRNEIQSLLISSVGNDDNGKELLDFLTSQGLSIQAIQTSSLLTGIVDVHLDANHHATYTIVKPVAWDAINYSPEIQKETESADALLFGSLACRSNTSRETLYKLLASARLKVLDLNLRTPHFEEAVLTELIHKCDILKINEDELEYLSRLFQFSEHSIESSLLKLAESAALKTVCVTLGGKGAMVYHQQQLFKHAGFKVDVVDTVGSGDAFLATFLAGLLKDIPMADNLARACAAGALVASRKGANPHYSMEDIDEILFQ